jgi:hypothetical protein
MGSRRKYILQQYELTIRLVKVPKYDDMLNDLRNGADPSTIRKTHGSGADSIRAFNTYLDELGGKIIGDREQYAKIVSENRIAQAEHDRLETSILKLADKDEKAKKSSDENARTSQGILDGLQKKRKREESGLEKTRKTLSYIKAQLEDLEKKGITQELVERIHSMELES